MDTPLVADTAGSVRDMILVLGILVVAVVFLVTEWIPMEVVALLVLASLALTGLVTPEEALSGFSNPAVITIWAVFILSGGLSRTGVASRLGRRVQQVAGSHEARMIAVIMVCAALISSCMNNLAVVALMLPVVMDLARRTRTPPSRLLLPLAFGAFLGGMTTLIGTPPNLLASEALTNQHLPGFHLFDFTPVGVIVALAGIAFMALVGRHLLPTRDVTREASASGQLDLREQYNLHERAIYMRVPPGSPLAGKTLAETHIGLALGLNVLGIRRDGEQLLLPGQADRLAARDLLLVQGRLERMNQLAGWRELVRLEGEDAVARLTSPTSVVAEITVQPTSNLIGKSVGECKFFDTFHANVLAIRTEMGPLRPHDTQTPLDAGTRLLVHGASARVEALQSSSEFGGYQVVEAQRLREEFDLGKHLIVAQPRSVSLLVNKALGDGGLKDVLGLRVIGVIPSDDSWAPAEPDKSLEEGNRLLILGQATSFDLITALESLLVEQAVEPNLEILESEHLGLMEAVLSPRSQLAGKRVKDLRFRDRYGLSLLAVWRGGRSVRSNLRDHVLREGDALLLYGPRGKLRQLGRDPDFLVLTEAVQEAPRSNKAWLAIGVMLLSLVPVIAGVVPISIATVAGAALMVLTRCLTMEEAYRTIAWKGIFLIAGLLPLGLALDSTGAAKLVAEQVIEWVGPFGPGAILAAVIAVTLLATCLIPTAALVVLMAPIVFNLASELALSPQTLMMAVAIAASATFHSPVAHPANLLVMGPGGYRFVDYLKTGGVLSLFVGAVLYLILPRFWVLSL